MPHVRPTNPPANENSDAHAHPQAEADLVAVRRVADGLDVDDRGPLEAEVMLWRICSAKSIPDAAIRRAISEEWESEK
jgi:hypothetical protein